MTVSTLHVTGTRGEITPLMASRVDTEFIQSAYAKARNTVVTRYGPHTRVPGTLAMGRPKNNSQIARFLPFIFNEDQVYLIEVGHQYMRFWTPNGQVFSGPTPYEIYSPFTLAQLPNLHARQSGDVLYIFGGGRPQLLKRMAETNWTIEPMTVKDGPYQPLNTTATTLRPSADQRFNTSGSILTGPSPGGSSPSRIFDRDPATFGNFDTASSYIGWGLFSGSAVVNAYMLQAPDQSDYVPATPVSWQFQGSSNGLTWTTLDSRNAQTGWAAGERRYFEFENKVAFRYYRLIWNGVDGHEKNYSALAELLINRAPESQTPMNLTASSTQGINGGAGFQPTDVGRSIRLLGSDGRWRWAEIVSRSSTTVVQVLLHGHALPDLSPFLNWSLGVFHGDKWPYTGTIFEDRMVLAGHDEDPLGVWVSVSSAYDNFRQSQPLVADDGFSLKLTGGTFDMIRWLAESGQLLAGTASVLRSIGTRNQSNAMAHDNARQQAQTLVGASAAQPVNVENVILFIDRNRKRLYETAYSFEADGYMAREVSTLSGHLFLPGVEQLAYLNAPHKFVVVRRADGKLVFFAYDREQRVAGGTLVDLGGVVEEIAILPGADNPELWMIVRRTRGGQQERFIEKLAPFFDEDDALLPVYGASAYTYDGAATTGLTGLDALRGVTVGVWADGRDIGDATVTAGGVLTLPQDVTASKIVVGERLPWEIRTLRLNQYGQQDGAGLGRKIRILRARLDLLLTAGVLTGSVREQLPLRRDVDALHDPEDPTPLVTGFVNMPVDDSFQNEGVLVIRGSSMHPATIRAIALDVEGEP